MKENRYPLTLVQRIDAVQDALRAEGLQHNDPSEIKDSEGDGRGFRVPMENGAIVNIYNTGTVQVQGINKDVVEWALRGFIKKPPSEDPRLAQ